MPELKDKNATVHDTVSAVMAWHSIPLEVRQNDAAHRKEIKDYQEAHKALGLPPPSSADIAAINRRSVGQQPDDVAEFREMAQRSGTTLPEVLKRYRAAEDLLERDAPAGIDWLCRSFDIDPIMVTERGRALDAAEKMLEREPLKAVAYLASHYGISPQQIAEAMAR